VIVDDLAACDPGETHLARVLNAKLTYLPASHFLSNFATLRAAIASNEGLDL
jgi:hypothetical protein